MTVARRRFGRRAGAATRPPNLWMVVLRSLRPYRVRIALALIVLLAGLAATLAGPALVGYAINDGLVLHHSMRTVNIAGAAYVGVSIAYFAFTRLRDAPGLGHRRVVPQRPAPEGLLPHPGPAPGLL